MILVLHFRNFLLATMEMRKLIILMFFLLSSKWVSSSQSNEECNPVHCGAMKLASPFYVAEKQPPHCGLPAFEVSCQHNSTLLNLSGDTYIIKTISYKSKTLRIVNSVFSHPTLECSEISSIHSFVLDNSSPLEYSTSEPSQIVLLQDCSIDALKALKTKQFLCNRSSATNSSISFSEEHDWQKFARECKLAVSVPYEDSGATNLEDKIRVGFTLKWSMLPPLAVSVPYEYSGNKLTPVRGDQTGEQGSGSVRGAIKAVTGFILFSSIVISIVHCIRRCCRGRRARSGWRSTICGSRTSEAKINLERFVRYQESMALKRYTYVQIKAMTNSLREKLGEGGFSVVYKGKLLCGRRVAVKLLKQSEGNAQDFFNELASVSGANHVNVVSLLGFCFEGRKRCLVYEFMPNGSLDKYRRVRTDNNNNNTPPLTWEACYQISLGIARGLEYLHMGCNMRILHFDIKPHNILLGDNFCPKISDFGLAKLCPQTERSTVFMSEARGTVGYIAPEVFCRNYGDVSQKSDVYSYGMLVLEVIGCRENTNASTSISEYFPQWVYKQLNRDQEQEDNEMGIHEEGGSLKRKMILVSLWCIQTFPSNRPSMDKVVQMLEGSLDSIEVPPVPTLTSPPRSLSDPSGSSTITIDSFSAGASEE